MGVGVVEVPRAYCRHSRPTTRNSRYIPVLEVGVFLKHSLGVNFELGLLLGKRVQSDPGLVQLIFVHFLDVRDLPGSRLLRALNLPVQLRVFMLELANTVNVRSQTIVEILKIALLLQTTCPGRAERAARPRR